MKLKPVAAGLAVGIFWGMSLFLLTAVAIYTGYMATQLGFLTEVYPFYEITWVGAVAGLVDGLIDGFFVGAVLSILYNAFAGCCKKTSN